MSRAPSSGHSGCRRSTPRAPYSVGVRALPPPSERGPALFVAASGLRQMAPRFQRGQPASPYGFRSRLADRTPSQAVGETSSVRWGDALAAAVPAFDEGKPTCSSSSDVIAARDWANPPTVTVVGSTRVHKSARNPVNAPRDRSGEQTQNRAKRARARERAALGSRACPEEESVGGRAGGSNRRVGGISPQCELDFPIFIGVVEVADGSDARQRAGVLGNRSHLDLELRRVNRSVPPPHPRVRAVFREWMQLGIASRCRPKRSARASFTCPGRGRRRSCT